MAREVKKLTDLKIKSLLVSAKKFWADWEAAEKEAATERKPNRIDKPKKALHADGDGLYLSVKEDGAASWILLFRFGGKRKELGLGKLSAVGLKDARAAAAEARAVIAKGDNPIKQRHDARKAAKQAAAARRFGEFADEILAEWRAGFRNDKHADQWKMTLEVYAAPLRNMLLAEIETNDILSVLKPIWLDKPETANRLRGRIERLLAAATTEGHRTGDNPARWQNHLDASLLAPKKAKEAKRGGKAKEHPAISVREVSDWWTALGECKGAAVPALQFLALTAVRSKNVRGMTWDEIVTDESGGKTWLILGPRMKAGERHRVPLSKEATEMLNSLPRRDDTPYVFPATRGGMLRSQDLSGLVKAMHRFELENGRNGWLDPVMKKPAVPHGLRTTFKIWSLEHGYEHYLSEIALSHGFKTEVERAYARTDMLERRRAMMDDWANFLTGKTRAGTVVPFNKGVTL